MKFDWSKLKTERKLWFLVLLGFGGVLLIALTPFLEGKPPETAQQFQQEDSELYADRLEQRLESLLAEVSGVGRVQVMVTLKSGYSNIYARSEKNDLDRTLDDRAEGGQKTQERNTTEQTYVLIDGAEGEMPLVTVRMEPEIRGVVVVCDGGADPATILFVTDLVRVALDIPAAMVSVCPMSAGAVPPGG